MDDKNSKSRPSRPNLTGGPPPETSELWLQPNRNLDWTGIANYALTIDGYALAEAKGFDLLQFANQKNDDFLRTGEWQGTFENLRCCLFGAQRLFRGREIWPGEPGGDLIFFTLNQAICNAWESETGLQPDLPSRYRKELQHAIAAAQSAGGILRNYFHQGRPSEVDKKADEQIHTILSRSFPAYGYLGEEMKLVSRPSDTDRHLWLVDPQDGTTAASKGFRGAAVSIALLRDGHPVLGVVYAYAAPDDAGDLFYWAEGMCSVHRNNESVSRSWPQALDPRCTALISQDADKAAEANAQILHPLRYRPVPGIAYRLALVAAGDGDLAVSLNAPTGWDVGGGHALLLGAGGELFNQAGEAIRYDSTGSPRHSAILTCFGGTKEIVKHYIGRDWQKVFKRGSQESAAKSLSFLRPGKAISDPGVLDRAQGCLLGQFVGDALGSLVEFSTPQQISKLYPEGPSQLEDGGVWSTIAGQPTDDSELALALGRSIIEAGIYDRERAAIAYGRWLQSGPFDCGNTTRTALNAAVSALKRGGSAAEAAASAANSESQANGALMRISPLGIFGFLLDSDVVMDLARQDATVTHPNKICQDASAIFAATIAFAIRSGASPKETYDHAIKLAEAAPLSESVVERLRAAATSAPKDFAGAKMGWVLIAFHNAFFQLLHAGSLREGIVETVRQGGDTDTNGAIAGALLGSVYGREQIPPQWIDRVLACRPIKGLNDVKRPRPAEYWPVDALPLAENLLILGLKAAKKARPAAARKESEPANTQGEEDISSEKYAALMMAAQRLGYSGSDFQCAMGKTYSSDGKETTPETWRILRNKLDREIARFEAESDE